MKTVYFKKALMKLYQACRVIGVNFDVLTEEQVKYLNSWEEDTQVMLFTQYLRRGSLKNDGTNNQLIANC